jgi:hypothetical protein
LEKLTLAVSGAVEQFIIEFGELFGSFGHVSFSLCKTLCGVDKEEMATVTPDLCKNSNGVQMVFRFDKSISILAGHISR